MATFTDLFDKIYNNGGFYEGDSKLSIIKEQNFENVKLLNIIFDYSIIDRKLGVIKCENVNFAAEIKNHYNIINNSFQICPNVVQVKIEDCLIKANVIYLRQDDKYVPFFTSLRVNEEKHSDFLREINANEVKVKSFTNNKSIFFLGSIGDENYGHWLIDDLAKIKSIIDYKGPKIILLQSHNQKIDKRRAETLKFFCGNKDLSVHFIRKNEILSCKNIIYITPITYHPYIKNKNALSYIRGKFFNISRQSKIKKDKIFLLRHKKYKRQIENFKQLLPILKKHKIKIIDPENMSFAKQAKIFQNASLIIGTMGASMCNTLFSPNETNILYLAPNQWIEPFYWDLSESIGHKYNVIYGERCNYKDNVDQDNFIIDIGIFESELERLNT